MSITFSGVGSVVLPNSQFGDSQYSNNRSVVNRVRGLDVVVHVPGHTPINRETLIFRYLSKTLKISLQTFILANLGTTFTYTDTKGVEHNAMILTPDANFVAEGRELCESAGGQRSVSLELEIIP